MGRKPRKPDKERKAIQLLSRGVPQRQISKDVGLAQSTVCAINKRHKEKIQAAQARLIDKGLDRIIDRTIDEIETAGKLQGALTGDNEEHRLLLKKVTDSCSLNDYLKRVDKKEELLLKSVGLAPTLAPSFHIQNIFNDNRNTVLSPVVGQLLTGKLAEMTEDVEDAEFEEID